MTVKTPRSFALALALALQTSTCALPDPVLAVVATVTSWPEEASAEPLFEARAVAPADEPQADAGPAGRLAGGPAGLGPSRASWPTGPQTSRSLARYGTKIVLMEALCPPPSSF